MKQATQWLLTLAGLFLTASCGEKNPAAGARRVPVLTEAERILRGAHFATTRIDQDRVGRLRKGERTFPIGLHQRGAELQFAHKDPEEGGPVQIHARFQDGALEIYEMVGGKPWNCSAGRLGESIGGTDFSYEDVMMPWLLWPGGEILGVETIKGRAAWRIHVRNPEPTGQFRSVEVWVHQEDEAFVQAIGYDAEGRALKRFSVTDPVSLENGRHVFRSGRLERFDPETREVAGLSFLQFENATLLGAAR